MIPSPITAHVTEAKRLLTSMFRDRVVISGLLASYVKQVQLLEDAIWGVINGRKFDDAANAQLDTIGSIVGEKRQGRTDAVYRWAIRLRILINRSTGRVPELLHIIRVAADGNPWRYWESYPAGFAILFAGTVAAFNALKVAAVEAKPAGVGKGLLYTSGTIANLFRPMDAVGGTGGAGPTHTDGITPGYVVAHVEFV